MRNAEGLFTVTRSGRCERERAVLSVRQLGGGLISCG